jgi:hypothetical protein
MKKSTLLLIALLFISSFNFAQESTSTSEVVAETDVPAVVVASFKAKYTPTTLIRWEKKTFTGSAGKTYVKYVAVFDVDGLRSRSRYKEDGTGISTTTYYWFKNLEKLPQAIKDAAKNNYAGYKLGSAEKEHNLKSGVYVYRLRLKKGPTKLVAYVNEKGEEITKENLDKEILENESESGQ